MTPDTTLTDVAALVEEALADRRSDQVAPPVDEVALAEWLSSYDFARPRQIRQVTAELLDQLCRAAVRSNHPNFIRRTIFD